MLIYVAQRAQQLLHPHELLALWRFWLQIFQIIWDQSRRGISSVVVSSELEELLEICHRIIIMRLGRFVGEVRPENVTIEQLYSMCMGGEEL